MNIAFNINPLGFGGLGATLTSLLRNCTKPGVLKLWFLCCDCEPHHKKSIGDLLKLENFGGSVHFKDFDAEKIFGNLKPLHGDWTGYGRLLLVDHIDSDVVLYLDADLIVEIDVLTLTGFDFDSNFLAAVPGGKVKYALERNFLIDKLGLSPEFAYFNSGVMLLNLAQWRADDIDSQWKQIANQYPDDLLAIDQTLLNAVCKGKFAHLPLKFNNAWCPGDIKPEDAHRSIIHFVGSPKPWDVFGKTLHQGYGTWKAYSNKSWNNAFNKLNWSKIVRTWKIKNSILIKMRIKFSSCRAERKVA